MKLRSISALLSLLITTASTKADPSPHLKVGFIGALSGPGMVYGVACRRGVEMALEDLGSRRVLDVVYEDDQFDNQSSIKALYKLVDVDKVDAVVTLGSSTSKATAPVAQERKVPFVTWASDPSGVSGPFLCRTQLSQRPGRWGRDCGGSGAGGN